MKILSDNNGHNSEKDLDITKKRIYFYMLRKGLAKPQIG